MLQLIKDQKFLLLSFLFLKVFIYVYSSPQLQSLPFWCAASHLVNYNFFSAWNWHLIYQNWSRHLNFTIEMDQKFLLPSFLFFKVTNSSNWLHRSHVTQYCCGYYKLEYLWRYYEGTLMLLWRATMHPVAAEHPHSTLNGTPNCSSPIGTDLYETHYETHIVGQEEFGCV